MRDLTISEAAQRWNITPRRMQQLCKENAIPGARKQGRSWLIPADTQLKFRTKSVSRRQSLPLPIGITSYVEAVTKYYYVDKTLLIRDFIDMLPKVSLFTRPRRFGKTLNMDMLRVFFERSYEDTSVYFKDMKIWKCGNYYRSFQGKYPVIYLSFKDVKYTSWDSALDEIYSIIRNEFARHQELMSSSLCNAIEVRMYQSVIDGSADETLLSRSLAMLSSMLHKHYGKETVIIIDEYDTPIQQAYAGNYYDQAIGFFRSLFTGAFKDNPDLAYGFLSGILRITKDSIFSGINNLKINTILDDRYNSYFGFTKKEARQMLAYYGKEDKMAEVCVWYGGYQFGQADIINPWSVINYIDDNCYPKAFWLSTESDEIISNAITKASSETVDNFRSLMQGASITAYIDTETVSSEAGNSSGFYSYLLMTGYLCCTEIIPQNDGAFICKLSIPNREISTLYAKEIISGLNVIGTGSAALMIQRALFERNITYLQQGITEYITAFILAYDTTTEDFYQALITGMCAVLNQRYSIRSSRETVLGRFDIQLIPLDSPLPGYVYELKASRRGTDILDGLAEKALIQIEEKPYIAEMKLNGIREITTIGIAFQDKKIAIKSKTYIF